MFLAPTKGLALEELSDFVLDECNPKLYGIPPESYVGLPGKVELQWKMSKHQEAREVFKK